LSHLLSALDFILQIISPTFGVGRCKQWQRLRRLQQTRQLDFEAKGEKLSATIISIAVDVRVEKVYLGFHSITWVFSDFGRMYVLSGNDTDMHEGFCSLCMFKISPQDDVFTN
jgi:hypothetical protein